MLGLFLIFFFVEITFNYFRFSASLSGILSAAVFGAGNNSLTTSLSQELTIMCQNTLNVR